MHSKCVIDVMAIDALLRISALQSMLWWCCAEVRWWRAK